MAGVTLRGVAKRFGTVEVLPPLSLDIADGEFVALVGPSGCGKTTTLNLVAGLLELSAGEIRIGDRLVNDLDPRDRDVAMVFQNYALYPTKTVRANLAFPLEMRRLKRAAIEQQVARAAELLGITHLLDRRPRELSGGQQQRVALGRALVRDPAVFLMDEPLSNLDAKLRVQMRAELKRFHQELSATVIYVTHDQLEAMTMADRMAVMHAGVLQQYDTPERVFAGPANLFVAGFVGSPPMNLLAATIEGEALVGERGVGEGGWRLPLTGAALATARAAPSPAVTLGFRHGAVAIHAESRHATLAARVFAVEPTGDQTFVHLRLGSAEAIVSMPPGARPDIDSTLHIAPDPSGLHLFDTETGKRQEPPAP